MSEPPPQGPAPERTRIENPFTELPDYRCFFCSPTPSAPEGLRLEFWRIGEREIETDLAVGHAFGGFPHIAHAGFVTAILDELAWWTTLACARRIALTASMEIEFKRALKTGEPIHGHGRLEEVSREGRFESAGVVATITAGGPSGAVLARARVKNVLPPASLFCRLVGFEELPAPFRPYFPDAH